MLIDIPAFSGEIPSRHPRRLPPGAAQVAAATVVESGALRSIKAPRFVSDLGGQKRSIYLNGASWLTWDGDVQVVPGPTAQDRLYITGHGAPLLFADDLYRPLALPAPTGAPTAVTVSAPDPDLIETVLYAYTWVTSYGEESAPSPLSAPLDWSEGVDVRLSNFDALPAGRAITAMRIYRSQTSSLGDTQLMYFTEVPAPFPATYDHILAGEPLVEPISTLDHDTPPDDLRGLISMPNGMMVAHTDRELLFCEPYQPHAWPRKYALTVDYDIVGLAAFGTQLAVLTKGTPYRGQGHEPSTFALEKVEQNLPCVSAAGIVDLGYAAAYPSTDGLVIVTSGGAQVVSSTLFTREQWQKLQPETIVAGQYDGKYVFGFAGALPTGAEKSGVFDLSGQEPFFTRLGEDLQCAYHDIRTGKLYLQRAADNFLVEWDAPDQAGYRDLTWRSALFDLPTKISFAVALFEGRELGAGTFAADIIADGAVIHTITQLNTPARLPAIAANHWEVEIRGQVELTTAALATSMAELSRRA